MTPELAVRNLALYSLQIVIMIAVASLLPWVSRLRAPRPQLAFWYVVLAICVLLPVVEPWTQPPVQTAAVSATSIILGTGDGSASHHRFSWPFGWAGTVLMVLGLGAVARAGLLSLGILRLRRLRGRGEPVAQLASLESAAAAAGVSATFLCSDEIAGPVTFGLRDPVVLVPPRFFDLDPAEQESVALHELLHVRRRDWLSTLVEECVRAVLWFHPAVWFLLNRVQLAREQSVDESVVRHMQRSESYVGALLKIAAARIEPDLAPAPLFLKKRHLRERVAAIVEGVQMSKSRLTLTMIAMLSVLPVVAGLLVWQIPLLAAPQEVRDAQGVVVNTGNFKVLHRSPVEYPAEARTKGISGGVVVSVSVNGQGEVTDAAVASGPVELRSAALRSILGWHFSTEGAALPPSFEVAVHFTAAGGAKGADQNGMYAGPSGPFTVERIYLDNLPQSLREKVAAALMVRLGDVVTPERFTDIQKAVQGLDSHLLLHSSFRGDKSDLHGSLVVALDSDPVSGANFGGVVGGIVGGVPGGIVGSIPAVVPGTNPQRIRVGGGVQAANLIKKVTPTYPVEAKQAGIQGAVKLQAVIGKDGVVKSLELLSGPPELVQSATDSVKQWVYRPTLLNGEPVEVITQIDVNYTLAK